MGNQGLTELEICRMVKIKVLPACKSSPRKTVIDLIGIRTIGTSIVGHTCPQWGCKISSWLCLHVFVGDPGTSVRACYLISKTMPVITHLDLISVYLLDRLLGLFILRPMEPCMVLFHLPSLETDLAVCNG